MRRRRASNFAAGLVPIVLIAVACWFAFAKQNPFADPYELRAVFTQPQNLRTGLSPVRIAGVEVGKVTEIDAVDIRGRGAAVVTMEIEDEGLPIHSDAELKVRPRLFLEGNFFIDVKPGSPSAPTLDSGSLVPLSQTSSSVSFGQVLKVLEKDTRQELRTLLDELDRGLSKGGAKGFNRSIEFWEEAYRNTALANQALLGTEPAEDIPRLLRGQQQTFAALSRHPQALASLVTDLNATTAAFAREDEALAASIPALRDTLAEGLPALTSLNEALPELRRLAREALPGVRGATPALAAAQPFIEQLRRLLAEVRPTSRELRRAVPPLARLNARTTEFLQQARPLSSCTANVLVPFAETPIPDPDFPDAGDQPFYKDVVRGLVGLAGESRDGDANGQWFRLHASGTATSLVQTGETAQRLIGLAQLPTLGARPAPSPRPRFRPDVACETQQPPDMAAPLAAGEQPLEPDPDAASVRALLEQAGADLFGERSAEEGRR